MGWAQRYQYPMGSAGPVQVLLALWMGWAHAIVFQSDGLGPALPIPNAISWARRGIISPLDGLGPRYRFPIQWAGPSTTNTQWDQLGPSRYY
jgi:hypothetical protein